MIKQHFINELILSAYGLGIVFSGYALYLILRYLVRFIKRMRNPFSVNKWNILDISGLSGKNSKFNGKHRVDHVSENSFSYTIKGDPKFSFNLICKYFYKRRHDVL